MFDKTGGFKSFSFSPLPGEMIPFDEHIFQMGSNHQLVLLVGWLVTGFDSCMRFWHLALHPQEMEKDSAQFHLNEK